MREQARPTGLGETQPRGPLHTHSCMRLRARTARTSSPAQKPSRRRSSTASTLQAGTPASSRPSSASSEGVRVGGGACRAHAARARASTGELGETSTLPRPANATAVQARGHVHPQPHCGMLLCSLPPLQPTGAGPTTGGGVHGGRARRAGPPAGWPTGGGLTRGTRHLTWSCLTTMVLERSRTSWTPTAFRTRTTPRMTELVAQVLGAQLGPCGRVSAGGRAGWFCGLPRHSERG